ncbi:MAG: 1,4-alpha-glucan branching protein GlgB [Clostridia bacterium]
MYSCFTNESLNLFHQGKLLDAYKYFGVHLCEKNGIDGAFFVLWAPHAKQVEVIGDFNKWIPNKLEKLNISKSIWSTWLPMVKKGMFYKFVITTQKDEKIYKIDPYAFAAELRPGTASSVNDLCHFNWQDKNWLEKRSAINSINSPISIYEMHLGSWKRKTDGTYYTYEELAPLLIFYLKKHYFTHVEFMPIMEHPLDASWGYQITGFYAATSRYGTPAQLKILINELHKNNIGVILDWAPSHFCKNEEGLRLFDGLPLYEATESWKSENYSWGTTNFNFSCLEVRSFLISNALFWINEFHIDGLRVDAVSNILYLDYGKKQGEWEPNEYGTNVDIAAVFFLKELATAIQQSESNAMLIAEESTTWSGITNHVSEGGLGFQYKWNMGWMHDTLDYISTAPFERNKIHHKLTFSTSYAYSENFILALSHDEVVHGKKTILDKVFGTYEEKFATIRTYIAYMFTHMGKKMFFMGTEFGHFQEWSENRELDWNLLKYPKHSSINCYIKDLNYLYINSPALWKLDQSIKGFSWIEADDARKNLYIFARYDDQGNGNLIVLNFSGLFYEKQSIIVQVQGKYELQLHSEDLRFGGVKKDKKRIFYSKKNKKIHQENFLEVDIFPLSAMIFSFKYN